MTYLVAYSWQPESGGFGTGSSIIESTEIRTHEDLSGVMDTIKKANPHIKELVIINVQRFPL